MTGVDSRLLLCLTPCQWPLLQAVVTRLTAAVQALMSSSALRCSVGVVARSMISDATRHTMSAVDSPEACELYCRAVAAICANADENCTACGTEAEDAVIPAVLRMMKAHLESVKVQEAACRALANLARTEDNMVKIVNLDGLGPIYVAMERHSTLPNVQVAACRALGNLAVHADNAVTVARDGLRHVYKAMDAHATLPAVQEAACGALANLALNDEIQVTMGSDDGLERVYRAMRVDSAGVQIAACLVLECLARNPANNARIGSPRVLELLYSVMDGNPTSAAAQEAACGVLCILAGNRENRANILSTKGLECVYAAMGRHSASAAVQEAACGALWTMAFYDARCKAKMVEDTRAVALTRAAQAAHPRIDTIQKAFRALVASD